MTGFPSLLQYLVLGDHLFLLIQWFVVAGVAVGSPFSENSVRKLDDRSGEIELQVTQLPVPMFSMFLIICKHAAGCRVLSGTYKPWTLILSVSPGNFHVSLRVHNIEKQGKCDASLAVDYAISRYDVFVTAIILQVNGDLRAWRVGQVHIRPVLCQYRYFAEVNFLAFVEEKSCFNRAITLA
jgi:hypothetical protein